MKNKLVVFFDEKGKFAFISTAVIMMLAHGFCFTNLMYSHDSLSFYDTFGLGKVSIGRWLFPFLVQQRQLAAPWLMGFLSTVYVSLAVVLVAKLYDLDKIQSLCVGILFASNVTLTSLFCTYILDADADCLALLLACFAAYSFKKFPKVLNIIIPIISLVLCMALYQAYLCVTVGLYIVLIILDSEEIKKGKDVLHVLFDGIKELATILIAIILNNLLMNAAAKHYGIELSDSHNSSGNLSSLSPADMIRNIPLAYQYIKGAFFDVTDYNTRLMVGINWIMVAVLIISLIVYVYTHKDNRILVMAVTIPCIIILPLGLNIVYLVSSGVMHRLMTFAFCIIYLLPIIFISKSEESDVNSQIVSKSLKYIKNAVGIICFIIIAYIGFNNCVYSNGAYVFKKLVYDNTALHAQTIWKDINNIEGYEEGITPVVFMGNFVYSKAAYDGNIGSRYQSDLTVAPNSSITYLGTEDRYYYAILGRHLNFQYDDGEMQQNPEYLEMPVYPGIGYCKMIGDKVVVRLQ